MLAEERYKKILGILKRDEIVKVSQLIQLFDVSVETIRRDMEYLESKKLLKRIYGGAILPEKENLDNADNKNYISFLSRANRNSEAKHSIAVEAIKHISEYDSIVLDSGTTTLELAKLLKNNFKSLTVLTNSLMILNELSQVDTFTVISTGGHLKVDEFSFIGDIAVNNISNFNINKAFISVNGISLEYGLTDWRLEELKIQKKMIEVSKDVMILADSTKFNSTSLLKICDIDDIDGIITERKIDEKIVESYKSRGINIYY